MQQDRRSGADILRFLRKEIFTIPNMLSVFRIAIIPHIISLYFKGQYGPASWWIVISFLSDVADGFIARHFDMISAVGKVLDPIADKLTQGMIFICLISRYRWLAWFTMFFAYKELTVLYLGFMSFMYTRHLDQAMWWGKFSTGTVVASLLLMVLFPSLPVEAVKILSSICVAVLLFSLCMYARRYRGIILEKITRIPGDRTASIPGTALAWLLTFLGGAAVISGRSFLAQSGTAAFIRENTVLITAAVFLLFLLKSAGLPVYTGLIYMVCGYLYGFPAAVCVCAAGGALMACIQYFRGKNRFAQYKDEFGRRLSAIDAYNWLREKSSVAFMFLVRLMCLPTEAVSIYMGITQLRFSAFLAGSFLGKLPDMILFAVMGAHITDIASAPFIAAAAVKILCSGALCLFLYVNGRKYRPDVSAQEQPEN